MGSSGTAPRALVVFDFDCSLVNEDSDARFCRALCPELLARLEMPPHTPPPQGWPALMDEVFGDFATRYPHVTQREILDVVGQIAVFPEMLEAVRHVVDEQEATVVIISDANTVFIESMLERHGLRGHVAEIHTNVGVWEESRLRVRPYRSENQDHHGCELCPWNLCKGTIVDELRRKGQYDVVLYVGDGIGDYCPSTRLTSRDIVFARANDAAGKSFGLLHRIESNADSVRARVVQWNTGKDVLVNFQETLRATRVQA